MTRMNIVLYPDAPLREKAVPVTHFGAQLKKLAADMVETMLESDGVGLAGPQVGIGRQILVLCEPEGEPICLVNPEIVETSGNAYAEEGCLSLPGLYANVPRATRIRVCALDCDGTPCDFEAQDFLARIIQHECDHLQGKVFPERLDIMTRDTLFAEWSVLRGRVLTDAAVS